MHVLVVGSSVIDLFLDVDKNFAKIADRTVSFQLGDKIPSEIKTLALGGNGANVSVGLTRLEIPTTFYTYLGDDILSREIEENLSREGVALASRRGAIKSAPLHIIFDFDTDRIIFSHYEKSDHDFVYSGDEKFDYIFLNSVAQDWKSAYTHVLEFAKTNGTPLAFSPGTRQLEDMDDSVKNVIKSSKIYFSNKEEAMKVLSIKYEVSSIEGIKKLLTGMKSLGPEIVSITDGAKGAYAIDANNNCFGIGPAPTQGNEKTGAGDAYAAGFFAAILHQQDIPTAMAWGTLNSGGVMQEVGAQKGLLTKSALSELLSQNADLKAKNI